MARGPATATPRIQAKNQAVTRAIRGPRRAAARVRPAAQAPGSEELALRKAPRQGRSRRIVETLLEAAALTFAELGYARATTNRIAERAGVSVGSLYQYFASKDALLVRLLAEHHREVHALLEPALVALADPAAPLEPTIRTLMTRLIEVHEAHPAIARALSEQVLRQSPFIEKAWPDDNEVRLAALLRRALEARVDVRRGDLGAMAAVLSRTTAELTRWLVHEAPPGMDRAVLLDETVHLLVRYVSVSAPSRAGPRPA